ncbi:MAG: hypothetical protein WCG52_11315, partial [bacterium]
RNTESRGFCPAFSYGASAVVASKYMDEIEKAILPYRSSLKKRYYSIVTCRRKKQCFIQFYSVSVKRTNFYQFLCSI